MMVKTQTIAKCKLNLVKASQYRTVCKMTE